MKLIKKVFMAAAFLAAATGFSQVLNKTQLIKSDHWIYDAMNTLYSETKYLSFMETAPLTAGEIDFYFKDLDRESLSDSGKQLYDDVDYFLHSSLRGYHGQAIHAAADIQLNPEIYYKSNASLPWSYRYFYRDNFATVPLMLGVSDYFTGELDLFLGRNASTAKKDWSFCNFPLAFDDAEFNQPTWAYGSAGITFDKWGVAIATGKTGLRIGKTLTGSIIFNDTFETNNFTTLNIYTKVFKYNLDFVQIPDYGSNKFAFLHQFEFILFKRFKFMFLEGTVASGNFSLQNLNPFAIMHSFGIWEEPDNNDRKSAQYMAFLIEFNPTRYSKLYGLMAQNEITMSYETSDGKPTSIGLQAGWDFNHPSKKFGGYWHAQIEGIWTMPYLYVKQTPSNSLISHRHNVMGSDSYINSWMGSPYGPDCMGFATEFGFEKNQKWSAKIGYSMIAHGENRDSMLYDESVKGEIPENPSYYPAVQYANATTKAEKDKALEKADNLLPSGTVEYTNQIKLKGTYNFNRFAQLSGQLLYTFVFNNHNITDNFEQGLEVALSCKINFIQNKMKF